MAAQVFTATKSLCSMFMEVSFAVGNDGMIDYDTIQTQYKYRPDSIDVVFEDRPNDHTILSKISAVTYAPNIDKRLKPGLMFVANYKIVVTVDKRIRCNLQSLQAKKQLKDKVAVKTVDKTHEIYRKIRKSVNLIPACFINVSCLTFAEAKQAERNAIRSENERLRLEAKQSKEQERLAKIEAKNTAKRDAMLTKLEKKAANLINQFKQDLRAYHLEIAECKFTIAETNDTVETTSL